MANINKIKYNGTDYTVDPTLEEESFRTQVTFNYGISSSTKFVKKGNMVMINYEGGETHNFVESDTLFTLPSGYRPKYDLIIPVVHCDSGTNMTYGLIEIDNTTGTAVILRRASSTGVSGTTKFYVTYFLE